MTSENNIGNLSHALLDTPSYGEDSKKELSSCWNSYGLYHTTQYVLRLNYNVHNLVKSATEKNGNGITWEEFQAYSTFIHETVHWWQHIGSTIGFIMSMCYPAEAHSNLAPLKYLAKSNRTKKPLKDWAENEMRNGKDHSDPDVAAANTAINNTLDIEFYRILMMGVGLESTKTNYFESTGHSFRIAYDTAINILRSLFDPEAKFLQNPDDWDQEIKRLGSNKVTGYYYGSPIPRYPIKGLDIIEGQARFIQLQFLSSISKDGLRVQKFEQEGYLKDEYGDAYRFFLENTNSKPPELIDSPLISLFLLLCDISLNPTEGFPKKIKDFNKFIYSTDCSYRFISLCNAVKENPQVKYHIKECSKKEYLEVAQILTNHCGFEHPYEIPIIIKEWKEKHNSIQSLLENHEIYNFTEGDTVIKVIFSHFLAFNLDKYLYPEFFCWAGKHLANKKNNSENRDNYEKIWLNNLSIFTDSAQEQTIVPRLFPGKPEKNIKKTFNEFYAANIMYGIGNQWILKGGAFIYDFSWLTEQEKSSVIERKVKDLFEKVYDINPDNIRF